MSLLSSALTDPFHELLCVVQIQRLYTQLLQMYGEKTEEVQELRMDVQVRPLLSEH